MEFVRDRAGRFRRRYLHEMPLPGTGLAYTGDAAAAFLWDIHAALLLAVGDENDLPLDETRQGSWPPGGLRLPTPAPVSVGARYGFVLAGRYHRVTVTEVYRFARRWKLRLEFTAAPQTHTGAAPSLTLTWQQFKQMPGLIIIGMLPGAMPVVP